MRGRIGYAVNNVLFYGTGGYAWIDNKLSLSALGVTVSDSKFHSGWTVGAGVEAFFAPQWSIKGEYLYRSFSGATYFSGIGLPFNTGTHSFHTVQFGVNYHFSGPVVASTRSTELRLPTLHHHERPALRRPFCFVRHASQFSARFRAPLLPNAASAPTIR